MAHMQASPGADARLASLQPDRSDAALQVLEVFEQVGSTHGCGACGGPSGLRAGSTMSLAG